MITEQGTGLVERLRAHLADASASSFQLMGDDLALLTGPDLRAAAAAYDEHLTRAVPDALRAAFEAEQRALLREAHALLRRHNHCLHARIAGYLDLGRRFGFEYPWPTVAVLGISTVLDGMARMRVYGLLGRATARLGLPHVERASERIDDALRRTNRAIFADSVPLTLLALRCHSLRRDGRGDLATALLEGPLPPLMDEECRGLARRLTDAFGIEDGARRYEALAALTLEHFRREQAVFTHHLGAPRQGPPRPHPTWLDRLVGNVRAVRAPRVERGLLGRRRLVFRNHRLPPGFDIRAHAPRVTEFGRAFVSSITRCREDYQAAVDHTLARFGAQGERVVVAFPRGGTQVR
ncbi:MAG: hypothetical protein M9894_36540 [Planctomycetes bacterium]|nr:hypothetical protein [Planctomycetota bacterium]